MLKRFAKWFSSAGGVWQTTVLVLAWWGVEAAGFIRDDQHFQLLVVLTIYSAITQPVLAYANRQDTDQGAEVIKLLGHVLDHVAANSDEELAADREELLLLREIAARLRSGGAP